MDFGNDKNKKTAKWIIGVVSACIIIFLAVQNIGVIADSVSWLFGLVMPLVLGFAFAVVINVPMRFFEAHLWTQTKKTFFIKLRRPISYIISLFIILGILVGVVWLLIPELVNAIKLILEGAIGYVKMFSTADRKTLSELPFGSIIINIDWEGMLGTLQNWLKNQSGNIMSTAMGTISSVVGGVFDLFISVVFSVYILFSKEKLKNQACRLIRVWLPERFGNWFIHASCVVGNAFRNFVSGQTIEAAILGTLCMIGMLILRIPYAPMVGALVGVTALIPIVGAFVGTIVGAFMILTVDPVKAVMFVVFLLVLQQIEGNLIYPKVMGSRVNLPAMWILAAVTVGGGIAGPVGMLLSVPAASSAYILIREATEKKEKSKKV